MLNGSFLSDNAFTLADVRRPTSVDNNYNINVAVREYGQVALVVPYTILTEAQMALLNNGELGYPLTDFLGTLSTVSGSFQRYRKTPTSAVSLQFLVASIVAA